MTAPIFIISGMPRSRTAWLANYMTTGNCFCQHEAFSRFDRPEDCVAWLRLRAQSGMPAGVSDHAAVLFQDLIAQEIPEARWVILRRPIPEIEESYKRRHGIEGLDLWAHKRKVDDAIMSRGPLVVDFPQVNARVRAIAEWCVPFWVHDDDRHHQLLTWNVQLTQEAMKTGIETVLNSGILTQIEAPKFSPVMLRAAEIMEEALAVNLSALQWWRELMEVVDVYDHTIDNDGRDIDKTHRAFKAMMLEWPQNAFLRHYSSVLVPVVCAAISAWQYGGRAKAADIYTEVGSTLIFLLHGQAGVERWMPEYRRCHSLMLAEDGRKDGE